MSKTKNCPFCGEEILGIAKKCKHCGEWLEEKTIVSKASNTTIIGAFASNYEIIEEVGRGGMAIVYKARQKSLDRIVALKVIPKEFTHDKEFIERFKREARDSAKLNHPNIIHIYDSGEIGGYPFMAMEYLEGGTISDLIRKKGKLSEEEIKKIIIPVLEGLGYAHDHGLIHRDIKSSNIMFDKTGRPVLMDFGIAKSAEGSNLTKTGVYMGTPQYSSPEQADSSKSVNHQTDIYSMGVVMYEMATGSVPFKGDNPISVLHDVIHKTPPNPKTLNYELSEGFSNAIMGALEKDLSMRYFDCIQFASAIKLGLKQKDHLEYPKIEKEFVKENKFWPSVRRVDEAFGDRNLICSCEPVENYINA